MSQTLYGRAALPLLFLGLLLTTAACDSGPSAVEADSTVTVAYVGSLANGTVFDQNSRATFSLNGVIPGFRDGLIGMMIGETKTFDIAPEDAYGAAGRPPSIPPNSTLTFEVTVLDIR